MSALSSRLEGFHQGVLGTIRHNQTLIASIISVITLLLTLVPAMLTGQPPLPRDSGSSAAYESPSPAEQAHLDKIRGDLLSGVNELRGGEFDVSHRTSPPVTLDPLLFVQAEASAKSNAVTGVERPINANVGSVQAHMPREQASAHGIMEQWLSSPSHTAVLLDPQYAFYGVGVAQSDDSVWAVIVFSRP